MNSTMPGEDTQQENYLAKQGRNATSNVERAEVLRDKLEQMLERLRGPAPKPAPEQENKNLVEQGSMPRLVMQLERTSAAIETALSTLSEIEQYV